MRLVKTVIDFVMDILETVTFVGSLFIVVYLFIMQPNQVKGRSMEPTFVDKDYIFTSKITYQFRQLERGDVIVFKSPKNPDVEFIKRIIGLPGDKVRVDGGVVYVNGMALEETYTSTNETPLWENGFIHDGVQVTIPQGQIFVMGDNRPMSSDSRDFGPVDINSIIGQVFYRYYPLQKTGVIDNPLPLQLHTRYLLHQIT